MGHRPISFAFRRVGKMERSSADDVDPRNQGYAGMQRVKHPPIRNKIDLAESIQVRAWTRRLDISSDALKAIVDKVGNSVAAVTKEVELQRTARKASLAPARSQPADGELPTPV